MLHNGHTNVTVVFGGSDSIPTYINQLNVTNLDIAIHSNTNPNLTEVKH